MLKQYVKILSRKQIAFAPTVKGNVSNYHLCEKLLTADGYKPLDASTQSPSGGVYTPYYEDAGNVIVRKWEKQVTPEPTYYEKRAAAYPPITDYLDAMVKINSGNEEMMASGQQQLTAYYEHCNAVKRMYPKTEEGENQDVSNN